MNTGRRGFFKASGSVLIYFSLTGCDDTALTSSADSNEKNDEKNAEEAGQVKVSNWIQLNANGTVGLALGKVELGQGIGTALAQIAAEELRINFERIELLTVDTDHSPNEYYTFSSISVQVSGKKVRKAAASAFDFLRRRAANELEVSIESLSVIDGEFYNRGEQASLSYWQLLEGEDNVIEAVENPELMSPSNYKVVGKSIDRSDIPGKVFGEAAFIQDLRLENMLHARLVRPPAPRATLEHINSSLINNLSGIVKVVHDGDFVAVIAEQEGQARAAATKLKGAIRWKLANDLPSSDSIYHWLKNTPSKLENVIRRHSIVEHKGKAKNLSAVYQRPYQCHASISPSAAVALYDNETLTVWSHAQGMYPLRDAIALILGLDKQQVRCIHKEASGCYGHNGADDAACEAAVLAMQTPGRPVRLQWERGDEFLWEPLGSAMQVEVSADIDSNGMVNNWQYNLWSCTHSGRPTPKAVGNFLYAQLRANSIPVPSPRSIPQPNGGSDRNAIPLYNFPSLEVNKHLLQKTPLRTSALRGLGAYANIFAIESFMDELAHQTGHDPLAFRIKHLDDQRAIAVLKKVAELSQWNKRPNSGGGLGWGIGFAQFKNLSSYFALVIKLDVDPSSGDIKLRHATAVCDAGLVINPDGLRAQLEGAIIQSASWTLMEQMAFNSSRVLSDDWSSYPILRFDQVPDIEIYLIENNDSKALGVGETAQGPTAAAIANAISHASGQRLRQIPLSAQPFLLRK